MHRSVAATAENCGELILPLSYQKRAAYTAGTEATTGVVIDEEQQELLLPLEANLVLSQAGVRMMTGLVGNIYWPKHTAAQVFWEGENGEAKDGKGEFSKGKLYSPKRLTALRGYLQTVADSGESLCRRIDPSVACYCHCSEGGKNSFE